MEISQILLKPSQNKYIIQYSDNVGKIGRIQLEAAANTQAAALITDAQARLPSEQNRPNKGEIEQEITELEYRLKQLKISIGQT
jgi:hypothetical protein